MGHIGRRTLVSLTPKPWPAANLSFRAVCSVLGKVLHLLCHCILMGMTYVIYANTPLPYGLRETRLQILHVKQPHWKQACLDLQHAAMWFLRWVPNYRWRMKRLPSTLWQTCQLSIKATRSLSAAFPHRSSRTAPTGLRWDLLLSVSLPFLLPTALKRGASGDVMPYVPQCDPKYFQERTTFFTKRVTIIQHSRRTHGLPSLLRSGLVKTILSSLSDLWVTILFSLGIVANSTNY